MHLLMASKPNFAKPAKQARVALYIQLRESLQWFLDYLKRLSVLNSGVKVTYFIAQFAILKSLQDLSIC